MPHSGECLPRTISGQLGAGDSQDLHDEGGCSMPARKSHCDKFWNIMQPSPAPEPCSMLMLSHGGITTIRMWHIAKFKISWRNSDQLCLTLHFADPGDSSYFNSPEKHPSDLLREQHCFQNSSRWLALRYEDLKGFEEQPVTILSFLG